MSLGLTKPKVWRGKKNQPHSIFEERAEVEIGIYRFFKLSGLWTGDTF